MIGVLVLGAVLRINHLNDESLWLDEGITYYNSSAESFEGVWDKTARLDQSPPGYYFLMHEYLDIFGENEFGFRLVSVVFGVLSILFLYLLIAAMFNRDMAIIAAALLAINSFHIGFSMEARMYVLLSLEALMGFYFLYKALSHEARGYLWWGLFTASSIAGFYTHTFYFFVFLALAIIFFAFLALEEKKTGKFFMGLLSALLTVIAFLPWVPSFLNQLSVERYWIGPNSLADIKLYFIDFANGDPILFWLFLALAVLGIVWRFISKRPIDFNKKRIFTFCLISFVLIGIGIPLLYSRFLEPILKIRYVVYIVPIWMSLVALGIYSLRRLNLAFPIIILALITYLSAPWQAPAYPIEFGEDFRALAAVVNDRPTPVVVHTPSIAHIINFYNEADFDVRPFPYSDDLTEYNFDETAKNKFLDLVKDYDSFYLVVSHTHENPPGLLMVWSDGICKENKEIEIDGMDVWLFNKCKNS